MKKPRRITVGGFEKKTATGQLFTGQTTGHSLRKPVEACGWTWSGFEKKTATEINFLGGNHAG